MKLKAAQHTANLRKRTQRRLRRRKYAGAAVRSCPAAGFVQNVDTAAQAHDAIAGRGKADRGQAQSGPSSAMPDKKI